MGVKNLLHRRASAKVRRTIDGIVKIDVAVAQTHTSHVVTANTYTSNRAHAIEFIVQMFQHARKHTPAGLQAQEQTWPTATTTILRK